MSSNIRKKLANLSRLAEDENTTTPEGGEATTTETPESAPAEAPATDATTAPESGDEAGKSDQDFLNAIQSCGITLANPEAALRGQKWGKLGAFDLLNTNEFANQVMSAGNTQAAAKLVMDKINELDSKLGGFEQYNKLGEAGKKTLQVRMQKAKSPTDIVFLLSNSGLKGSGMGSTVASLDNLLDSVGLHSESTLSEVLSSREGMSKVAALLTLMLDK